MKLVYEAFVEGDRQSQFFTTKAAALRYVHSPEGEGDWGMTSHDAAEFAKAQYDEITDLRTEITDLRNDLDSAVRLLLKFVPHREGCPGAHEFAPELIAAAHAWLSNRGRMYMK